MVRQATIAGVTTAVILIVIIVIIAVTIYIRLVFRKLITFTNSQRAVIFWRAKCILIKLFLFCRRRREAKKAAGTSLSQEQLQRIPFGRALSRTDQFKAGSAGGSAVRVLSSFPSHPSTYSGASQIPARVPERQALLSPVPDRFGQAPRAAVSEMNLSDGDTNDSTQDVRITVHHDAARYIAQESPHPYSASESSIAPSTGGKRFSNVT